MQICRCRLTPCENAKNTKSSILIFRRCKKNIVLHRRLLERVSSEASSQASRRRRTIFSLSDFFSNIRKLSCLSPVFVSPVPVSLACVSCLCPCLLSLSPVFVSFFCLCLLSPLPPSLSLSLSLCLSAACFYIFLIAILIKV